MATNLAIDDRLIEEAKLLGGHPTKKAAVTKALEDYVSRIKQQRIVGLFNTVDYDDDYDYKAQRKRG